MPRHVAHVPVRWSDLDALGRVDSVVFLRYLQEARVDLLFVREPLPGGGSGIGGDGAGGGSGIGGEITGGLVVAAHDIEFREPLHWRVEPVRVELWVSDVRNASFTIEYEIADESSTEGRLVYAWASTMLVPYDLRAQRPRRLEPGEKSALERLRQ